MSLFEHINQLNQLPENAISIFKIIDGNSNADNNLIIIPGFSQSSFDRNYETLFLHYPRQINLSNFNHIYLIQFAENHINKLYKTFFNKNNIIDPNLECILYEKCAELLANKLDMNKKYSVLAKSTGTGPALFLCNQYPEQISKLYLFAPRSKNINIKINKVKDNFPKTIVGWNSYDTKINYIDIWPSLVNILPLGTILITFYIHDNLDDFDTQDEINSYFFDKII